MAKRRCRSCREYFDRDSHKWVGAFCTDECMVTHRSRQRPTKKIVSRKPARRGTFTSELKAVVRKRDHNRCRWCGVRGMELHCHHVRYRSEGGPDEEANLMALCLRCHERAHSNKRLYQPLLLATLWLEYFYGERLQVPVVEKWLAEFDEQAA